MPETDPMQQTPLEILTAMRREDPERYALRFGDKTPEQAARDEAPIIRKHLADLLRRNSGEDPDELLRDRYLCRGGTLLFAGPTGVGKSSLIMQALILWALGRDLFGIRPARPLRSLLIQAENDDGDLAEMRDGVLHGLGLSQAEQSEALSRVDVISEDAICGEDFAPWLAKALENTMYSLVVVDPVFAFVGGDASAQKVVTPWLRNNLLPVVHAHQVGLVLVHHTNKPKTGEEKSTWAGGDFAYLGSGSAEWANFARAVLALRSVGSATMFELIAGKRGRRLGWTDAQGMHTESQHVAHAIEPGRIYWRTPTPDEVAAEGAAGAGDNIRMVVAVVDDLAGGTADGCTTFSDVAKSLKAEMPKTTLHRLVGKAVTMKLIAKGAKGSFRGDPRKQPLLCTDEGKVYLGKSL
jgi:hypothetical protein